jgi:hypothetical protein
MAFHSYFGIKGMFEDFSLVSRFWGQLSGLAENQ